MNLILRCIVAFAWLASLPSLATAQNDRVYTTDGKNTSGEISRIVKQGIQIKRGRSDETIPAGEIVKILYQGEPSGLTQIREFALDTQYQSALDEIKKLDVGAIKRSEVVADAAFYNALSLSKLALAGRGSREAAFSAVRGFVSKHKDSWHFYEAAELLGDLSLAMNKPDEAKKFYGSLRSAPSTDTKAKAVFLAGKTALAKKDTSDAIAQFDKLLGVTASTPGMVRLQTLAKSQKAIALAQSGKAAEGLTLLDTLIAELSPTDIDTAARIYNAQGVAFEASGDTDGAIEAYLHTHLMFSSTPDAHAEAMKRLVPLWTKVGKPDRAGEFRSQLKELYPGY